MPGKPPKKDDKKKKNGSIQDWITDTAKSINKGREDIAKGAYKTATNIASIPDKIVKGAGAYPGIAENIGKATKAGADRLSVKLGNKNFKPKGSSGGTGGSGGGSTKRIPSPAKPKVKPTRGNVRKIK